MDNASIRSTGLALEFPQSLAIYDAYDDAQRAVDHLADQEFPVQHCMIVGTDLKQVERITGRLSYPRVAGMGALSGLWFGAFLGLLFGLFVEGSVLAMVLSTALLGIFFGMVWAIAGYLFTGGRRDFSSVKAVVATRYEVLVEHKHREQARQVLARTPGLLPDPFA